MLAGLERAKVVSVLRQGRGSRLRHRARPAPGGGVLPQQRDPLVREPRDPRARPALDLPTDGQQASENPELTGWTEAKRIRDLLKFEFFFPDRDTFETELREELELISRSGGAADPLEALQGSGVLMAHRVLRSFLDAQLVVADRLAHADPAAADRQGGPARRLRPGRSADAAPAPAALARVGLARAVRLRARPQGQLRPAGRPRRRVARRTCSAAVPTISTSSPA